MKEEEREEVRSDTCGLSHLASPHHKVHIHLHNIQYDITCKVWRKRKEQEGGRENEFLRSDT